MVLIGHNLEKTIMQQTKGKAASAAQGTPGRKFSEKQHVKVTAKGRHNGKKGFIEAVDMDSEDRPYLVTWHHVYNGGWFNEADLKAA
jgi:hypothetical protein